jgi:hypothetical protein
MASRQVREGGFEQEENYDPEKWWEGGYWSHCMQWYTWTCNYLSNSELSPRFPSLTLCWGGSWSWRGIPEIMSRVRFWWIIMRSQLRVVYEEGNLAEWLWRKLQEGCQGRDYCLWIIPREFDPPSCHFLLVFCIAFDLQDRLDAFFDPKES